MSSVSIALQNNAKYAAEKEKAKKGFLDRLATIGWKFWGYTEETGECSTKSYEGIL